MSLHVCIIGIDGSGKSSVSAALPGALAAKFSVTCGSGGEAFQVLAPDETLMGPGFSPDGVPLSARLSTAFKRLAKRNTENRALYPLFKFPQMLYQDAASKKLSRKYGTTVFVHDGNTVLSSLGRAANYAGATAKQEGDFTAAYARIMEYIDGGRGLPERDIDDQLSVRKIRAIRNIVSFLGIEGLWIPDMLIFLDTPPVKSLARIRSRRRKIDSHENLDDMNQARNRYSDAFTAFARFRGKGAAFRLQTDGLSIGENLDKIVGFLGAAVAKRKKQFPVPTAPLGTTREDLSTGGILRKIFNYRYIVKYLMAKWFDGAWREPFFPLSRAGRTFLKEGYSAGVMRVIYDREKTPAGLFGGIFLEYPLHRAVYDRLQILRRVIGTELGDRIKRGRPVRIFTAPSGFAYDLFLPLESARENARKPLSKISVTASDLDPYGTVGPELAERARPLGIDFRFLQGDLMSPKMRKRYEADGPFDIALFVGLSSWISLPKMIEHLKWVRKNIAPGGALVTDCFTAAGFALSGKYVGYKAHYFTPGVYAALMDYCGFDAETADVESGRDRINHVLRCRPRLKGRSFGKK